MDELQKYVQDGQVVADSGQWLGATVGAGLYVALLGLLALAVGALLRHSAGAITTMLGLVLLPLVLALFMGGEKLKDVRDFLMEYSPLNGLASLFRIPMADGRSEHHGLAVAGHPRRRDRRRAGRRLRAAQQARRVRRGRAVRRHPRTAHAAHRVSRPPGPSAVVLRRLEVLHA